MPIHAALHHVTHYQYDRLVGLGPQTIRLRPAPHCRSNVISYSLKVEPAQHFINWQQDPFANYQARLVFPEKTREFKVTVDLVVEMAVYNPFDFFLEPEAENISPFKLQQSACATRAGALLGHRPKWASAGERLLCGKLDLKAIQLKKLRTIDFLGASSTSKYAPRHSLCDSHGTRCANARRNTAKAAQRFLPRQRVGCWCSCCRHLWFGRALCVGLFDSAHPRREGARRPQRHRRWTSPICTPGARCICPVQAGLV